jgi:GPI mannosyltransferase 3
VIKARRRDAEENAVAALGEASTVQSKDMVVRPQGSGERLLIGGGVLLIVALAVVLRLVPILFVPSMNWGDEVFQTVEPAHRVVYGYGLMTWEFQLGMRSWLLPGAIVGLIEVGRLVGEGPEYYLAAIAVGLGILAAAPVVCAFLWCRRWFGLAGGFAAAAAMAVAPELVYFGARALNEVVAAHLLAVALYLIEPGYPVRDRRRLFVAGLVLGLVSLLRLQLAPAAALVALWSGVPDWRARLPSVIAGGLAAAAIGATLDWPTLGYPLASIWRNLFYNLHLGVSAGFSVEPWFFYLLGELGVWLAGAPFVLLLIWVGARQMPLLLITALVVFAVHMAVPHKEYRFIYPAIVLLMLLAAIGLAQLTARGTQWVMGRGLPRHAAAVVCVLMLTAGWSALAFNAWTAGALGLLRYRDHDELLAIAYARDLPAICGVGLYGEEAWVRYGGYSHLHRTVPLFWPKDEAALTEMAAGFDTLVTDQPPPASLGFATDRCFGEICVTRRSGACEPRPAARAWFPEQLRGKVSTETRLEALPRSARQATGAAARP